MKLEIKVDDRTIQATLLDHDAARQFAQMLPLNLAMKDLFRREKYARLPHALTTSVPSTDRYEVGDLAYWAPSQDLAIYYAQDGEKIPPPGIIPLARIEAGAEVFDCPGGLRVQIRSAK